MINFIKTIVSEEDYLEIKKIGNKYIVHLDSKRIDKNTIECYECMLNEEPDIEQLKESLAEYKIYIDERKQIVANKLRMLEIKKDLANMDYLTSKYIDGEDMSKYGNWQQIRKDLREEYRILEESTNE